MANPQTTGPAAPAAQAAAASSKSRINVLKYSVAGYLVINNKVTKTIVAAGDLFNAVINVLKLEGKKEDLIKEITAAIERAFEAKLVAKVTKDEEPDFTTVAADGGD